MLIGAVYCVYDESGFLQESVNRIYPVMDKIIFLLNFKPWYGQVNTNVAINTYEKILSFNDPNNKIEIISAYWQNEAAQRNYGLKILNDKKIDWCFIIDDDELYNTSQLKNVVNMLSSAEHQAYLVNHQIYWKNRNTIISNFNMALPAFARTNESVTFFENRIVHVTSTWFTIASESLLCHHMSYVRSDKKMLMKIKSFSHADEIIKNWYEDKWLKWTKDTTNLHPTNPSQFKNVISSSESKFKLEME